MYPVIIRDAATLQLRCALLIRKPTAKTASETITKDTNVGNTC